MRNLNHG